MAYRCSFRVTEAAYFIERMIEILAQKLRHGCRRAAPDQFHQKGAVPLPLGARLGVRFPLAITTPRPGTRPLEAVDYKGLRKEQAERLEAFKRGETRKLMGIA